MNNLQAIVLLLSFVCTLEVQGGFHDEACSLLAELCKADVACPDYELFYDQCMKKKIILLQETPNSKSQAFGERSDELTPGRANRLLELYQKESLREAARNEKTVANPGVNIDLQESSAGESLAPEYRSEISNYDPLFKGNAKLAAIKNAYVRRSHIIVDPQSANNVQANEIERKWDKNIAAYIHNLRERDSKQKRNDAVELPKTPEGQSGSKKPSLSDREEEAAIVHQQLDSVAEQKPSSERLPLLRGLLALSFSGNVSSAKIEAIGKVLQVKLWKLPSASIFRFNSHNGSVILYSMVIDPATFLSSDNAETVAKAINSDPAIRTAVEGVSGIELLSAFPVNEWRPVFYRTEMVRVRNFRSWDRLACLTSIIGGCSLGLIAAALIVCAIRRKRKTTYPIHLYKSEAVKDYQELCRSQMSVCSQAPASHKQDTEEDGSAMKNFWSDEPAPYNMDITTGHALLSYMEDHLKNENRLSKEWEALCSYKADRSEAEAGNDRNNMPKNRYKDVLPYDHSRVHLLESANLLHSDYINASFIMDVDPRNPDYIATQGPLDNTVADFWQMVWERGVAVIVNLTKLSDMGLHQCSRYWPEDGSSLYYIYEVHLISEHIWCDDYLVRSLYLKNVQTGETRTVTQFHYLTWGDLSVPLGPKALLEFRRKVNKCYRGQACPVLVHCNNGIGRTGTYILIDMVLNKMTKGAKEIDIAATLEHIRDQRADMVKTKAQFEFALAAVAEEVTAILSSITQ